ncbi:MAG TPA: hypothetical protein VF095_11230 [Bacillota bacterium]
MRKHGKHWQTYINKNTFNIDFHRFIELKETLNHMEIAQELGISLGEVKALKKKME